MWQRRASYCPLCGAPLARADDVAAPGPAGAALAECGACGFRLFADPATVAAAVVLDAAGRVLLVRRSRPPGRGAWALPAGYQDAPERAEEAAAREVREETGLDVRPVGLLALARTEAGHRPANLALFLCAPTGGELVAGDDAVEVGWFPLDALPEPLAFAGDRRILAGLREPERYALPVARHLRAVLAPNRPNLPEAPRASGESP